MLQHLISHGSQKAGSILNITIQQEKSIEEIEKNIIASEIGNAGWVFWIDHHKNRNVKKMKILQKSFLLIYLIILFSGFSISGLRSSLFHQVWAYLIMNNLHSG